MAKSKKTEEPLSPSGQSKTPTKTPTKPKVEEDPMEVDDANFDKLIQMLSNTTPAQQLKLQSMFGACLPAPKIEPDLSLVPEFLILVDSTKPLPGIVKLTKAIFKDPPALKGFYHSLQLKLKSSTDFLGLDDARSTELFKKEEYQDCPQVLKYFEKGIDLILSSIDPAYQVQFANQDGRSFFQTIKKMVFGNDTINSQKVMREIKDTFIVLKKFGKNQVSVNSLVNYLYNLLHQITADSHKVFETAFSVHELIVSSSDDAFHPDIRSKHDSALAQIQSNPKKKSQMKLEDFKSALSVYTDAEDQLILYKVLKPHNFKWDPDSADENLESTAFHAPSTSSGISFADAIEKFARYRKRPPSHITDPSHGKFPNRQWCLNHAIVNGELTNRGFCSHSTDDCRKIDSKTGAIRSQPKREKVDKAKNSPYSRPNRKPSTTVKIIEQDTTKQLIESLAAQIKQLQDSQSKLTTQVFAATSKTEQFRDVDGQFAALAIATAKKPTSEMDLDFSDFPFELTDSEEESPVTPVDRTNVGFLAQSTATIPFIFAALGSSANYRVTALLDSAASDHLVNLPREYFTSFQVDESKNSIKGIGNHALDCDGRGTVAMPTSTGTILVKDVMRVPSMLTGVLLLSQAKLARRGCTFSYDNNTIRVSHDGNLLFDAIMQPNDVYAIEMKDQATSFLPVKPKNLRESKGINLKSSFYLLSSYQNQFPTQPINNRLLRTLETMITNKIISLINFCSCSSISNSCNHTYTPLELAKDSKTFRAFLVNTGIYPPTKGTLEEWHLRTNHRNDRTIFHIASIPDSGVILTTRKRPPCTVCHEANAKTPSHKHLIRITRGSLPGEYYHLDIHFNTGQKSFSGYIMWALITDDFCRIRFIIFLKRKMDFHIDFRKFLLWSESQTGAFTKRMQIDGDRVFLGETLTFLESRGVKINPSLPGEQWQNGVSEFGGYQLARDYRTHLRTSGLPDEFWDEALRNSVHVSNLIPTVGSMQPWHSPYTSFTNLIPDYRSLIAFGAEVHFYLPKDKRPTTGKQEPRGRSGTYLGPAIGFKGYRIAVPTQLGPSKTYTIVQVAALTHSNEEPVKIRSRPDYLNQLNAERGITAPALTGDKDPNLSLDCTPSKQIALPTPVQNVGLSPPLQQDELKIPPPLTRTVDDKEVRRKRHADKIDITDSFTRIEPSLPLRTHVFLQPSTSLPPVELERPKKRVRSNKQTLEKGGAPSSPKLPKPVIPSKLSKNLKSTRSSARIHNRSKQGDPNKKIFIDDPTLIEISKTHKDEYFANLPAPTSDIISKETIPTVFLARTEDKQSIHFVPSGHKAFEAATTCLAQDKWKEAIYEECQSIINNGTYEGTDTLPEGVKAIKAKWVFTISYTDDGQIKRYKARLTARGDMQKESTESWSPTVSLSAIKSILSWSASQRYFINQFDIKTAFLNGTLDPNERVYMSTPPGLSDFTKFRYLHLLKALYGLKQAGRRWSLLFRKTLTSLNLIQSEVEECIFYSKTEDGRQVVLFFWVDDIIVSSPTQEATDNLMGNVLKIFKGKSLGTIQLFLGVSYNYKQVTGELSMNVAQYITAQINSLEQKLGKQIILRRTPMYSEFLANVPRYKKSKPVDMTEYAVIQGILTYVAQYRLDIAVAVNIVAQYSHQPTEDFVEAQYHILGYLSRTRNLEIHLGTQPKQPLTTFVDSDHAARRIEPLTEENGKAIGIHPHSRRSRTGAIWFYRGGCVANLTKQQSLPTDSSTYAEVVAAHDQLKMTLYLRKLITELERPSGELPPTNVFIDNLACIRILTSERITLKNSKHFETRFMFIKHYLGTAIHIHHVRTNQNLADFFTKTLVHVKFQDLLRTIQKADFSIDEIISQTIKSSNPEVLEQLPSPSKKKKSNRTKSSGCLPTSQ